MPVHRKGIFQCNISFCFLNSKQQLLLKVAQKITFWVINIVFEEGLILNGNILTVTKGWNIYITQL